MRVILENNPFDCEVTAFKDKNGNSYVPTSPEYMVTCLTTGSLLVDWTPLEAGETVSIVVPGTANKIVNQRNNREHKEIRLRHVDPQGLSRTNTRQYAVDNTATLR